MTMLSFLLPILFYILLILSLFIQVNARGLMCGPRQRASYHDDVHCGSIVPINVNRPQVRDFCGHCLNAGGIEEVRKNLPKKGWKKYNPLKKKNSLTRGGLCGDRLTSLNHMLGGYCMPYSTVPIVETWVSGSQVDFQVGIHTNHHGYFEFYLCDLDSCGVSDIDEKCFTEGHCYRLNRVPVDKCENPTKETYYECGPIDKKKPYRWYVPCVNDSDTISYVVGGPDGSMRYQLPEGLTCKHCVIQWYWSTANSCNPPGFTKYFTNYKNPFGTSCPGEADAIGGYSPTLKRCKNAKIPEEFWSCADVQISNNGLSLGTVFTTGEKPLLDGSGTCPS